MSVSLDKNNGAAIKFRPAALLRNLSTNDLISLDANNRDEDFEALINAELDARFAVKYAVEWQMVRREAKAAATAPTHLDLCRAAFPAPVPPFKF